MVQWIIMLDALQQDLSLLPRTHTVWLIPSCNSRSRRCDTAFWSLQTLHMGVYSCNQKHRDIHKIYVIKKSIALVTCLTAVAKFETEATYGFLRLSVPRQSPSQWRTHGGKPSRHLLTLHLMSGSRESWMLLLIFSILMQSRKPCCTHS